PLNELVVRGNVALLGGTDINYVMQDSPMDAKERPRNIVTFVSFREMDSQGQEETSQAIRIGGMDVLVNVDINNDSRKFHPFYTVISIKLHNFVFVNISLAER
ncbi:hypothetical protein NE555_16320, partial [Alistipes onderdonkii]|uniref:hypothetical protein n=1 Tax=Alistipes onderdonkii TaxID=328813 RepID=UPI00210D2FFB